MLQLHFLLLQWLPFMTTALYTKEMVFALNCPHGERHGSQNTVIGSQLHCPYIEECPHIECPYKGKILYTVSG